MPKFKNTYCSQCGQKFGPGDSGYSHCHDHLTEFQILDIALDIAVHRRRGFTFDRACELEINEYTITRPEIVECIINAAFRVWFDTLTERRANARLHDIEYVG